MEFTLLQPQGGCESERGAYVTGLVAGLREAGHACTLEPGTKPGHVPIIDAAGLRHFAPDDLHGAVALVHHAADLDLGSAQLPPLRRIVVPSQTVANALQTTCGRGSLPVSVLRPGVPHLQRSAGSGEPACRILAVGALVPRQGFATLIRALTRLFDLAWTLTIVGNAETDPAHAAALQAQIAADAPGRVRLAGRLDPAALEAAWQRSDLFATATEIEDDAGAVAEALRRGLPVSVTGGGAAAELVSPHDSTICAPGDDEAMSKALRRLIFDTGLRAEMAEAAWQAGRALPDWPAQARRFVAEFA